MLKANTKVVSNGIVYLVESVSDMGALLKPLTCRTIEHINPLTGETIAVTTSKRKIIISANTNLKEVE